jgi:putative ABC transport system ATP-binding protein
MLIIRQLSHRVITQDGELNILKNINLEIQKGESIAIVGASGSGKSTLLSIMAGLDIPSAGEVILEGVNISTLTEEQRAKIRQEYVAFVFQNFQLLNSLNALENVALPLEVSGDKNAIQKAEEFLVRVGLQDRFKHMPSQLSGGEQQRVALARAFACEAPIIFADEPTGNLDTETGKQISQLLFDMNKDLGTTLILVTHSEELAKKCDRIFSMSAGSLEEIISQQKNSNEKTINSVKDHKKEDKTENKTENKKEHKIEDIEQNKEQRYV